MKIIFSFFLGVAIGISSFIYVLKDRIPKEKVLSSVTSITNLPSPKPTSTIAPTLTISQIGETATPSITPSLTPSPKPPTPTKKPTTTPTRANSPTVTQTVFTPAPTQVITITPTPGITNVAKNYTSAEINLFIDRFSSQYNVDPNVMRHIAICESGFNPLAVNGPYAGLYQFSISAWTTYRNLIGESAAENLRLDAEEAVQTATYVASIGKSSIWPNCLP